MAALAIGLVWVGYAGGLWGYCLLRGYNVTPKQLFSSQWPPGPTAVNSPPSNPTQPGPNIPGTGPGGTTLKPGPGSAYGGK